MATYIQVFFIEMAENEKCIIGSYQQEIAFTLNERDIFITLSRSYLSSFQYSNWPIVR